LITVVARNNNDNVAKTFYKTMMNNRTMCEIMIVNDDIANKHRITNVPAAIFNDGRIIYEREMKQMILSKGGAKTLDMI
jgi:phage tail tube protein FII